MLLGIVALRAGKKIYIRRPQHARHQRAPSQRLLAARLPPRPVNEERKSPQPGLEVASVKSVWRTPLFVRNPCAAVRQPCPATGQCRAVRLNFNACFQQLTMVTGLHSSWPP
jgi:hypothetical protein